MEIIIKTDWFYNDRSKHTISLWATYLFIYLFLSKFATLYSFLLWKITVDAEFHEKFSTLDWFFVFGRFVQTIIIGIITFVRDRLKSTWRWYRLFTCGVWIFYHMSSRWFRWWQLGNWPDQSKFIMIIRRPEKIIIIFISKTIYYHPRRQSPKHCNK